MLIGAIHLDPIDITDADVYGLPYFRKVDFPGKSSWLSAAKHRPGEL